MSKIRILSLTSSESANPKIIAEAAAALREGKLIIMPTDTVYGVAADFFNEKSIALLQKIKKRPAEKSIPILAADCRQIEKIKARFGTIGQELTKRYWPGPLTLVLPLGDQWEGFRIPNHKAALAIIKAAGGLLRVTSANLSGRPPALTAAEAASALPDGVALAVDAGPAAGGIPSTVVKIINEKAIILREGAISSDAIYGNCRQICFRKSSLDY